MKGFIQLVIFLLLCWWIYNNCIGTKEEEKQQDKQEQVSKKKAKKSRGKKSRKAKNATADFSSAQESAASNSSDTQTLPANASEEVVEEVKDGQKNDEVLY